MARVSGEILIKRPVEEVFDYVADQRNEPIYNPRMLQSEKITDGPIAVGTRFRATARSGRRTVEMLIEVTEFQRPCACESARNRRTISRPLGSSMQRVVDPTRGPARSHRRGADHRYHRRRNSPLSPRTHTHGGGRPSRRPCGRAG